MMATLFKVLQLVGLFFNSAIGKQVKEEVERKLNKSTRPWYLSRRFVGVLIAVFAQIASNVVSGLDISDAQVAQITDYLLQGLDIATAYGGSLSVFGFTNRDK